MESLVNGEMLIKLLAVAVIANRFVAALFDPIIEHFKWDRKWLMYIAWVIAGLLSWALKVNVFINSVESPVIGIILTAIFAGGGANIFHDGTDSSTRIIDVYVEPDTELELEG